MRCLKVAFGLDDKGNLFKWHFGDSHVFAIYKICEKGKIELIEYRDNKAREIEEDHEHGHGSLDKFRKVIEQLHDVDVLAGWMFGPNFLRIKKQSNKVAFYTKTRDLQAAIKRIIENFDKLWKEVLEKQEK